MNKVFLIGNLTRDPESRTTASGITMCRFGLAVNRRRKVEGQPDADFFNITCFRQLADLAMRYLQKGRKVSIVGTLQINFYDAQDGTKRTSVDVVADDLEFLPNAQQQQEGGYAPAVAPAPKPFTAEPGFTEVDEDELPF